MRSRVSGLWALATVAVTMAAGCGPAAVTGPLDGEALFVAVPRPDSEGAALRAALRPLGAPTDPPEESFYLAVNRKVLGERWFLSAYIKQFFPGAVNYGAARSLGTRVVSFKVQNGKLFVFDVDDRKKTSDTFDPEVLVEAYPIVAEQTVWSGWSNLDKYVVIDPAAGLNRFGVLSDAYAAGSSPEHFEVDLAFLQRFRSLADGCTWEQVFTGHGEIADSTAAMKGERNAFRASGTLGLALRRYREGAGYQQTTLPPKEHYFRSDLRLVPNEGRTTQVAVKWNIHPGMQPIEWIIDSQVAAVAAEPRFAGYDIVGAIRRGVENWNQVFGFTALTARLSQPGESYADDDKNFIVFDKDPTYGAAFANWRTNPNTGEIRGASVYFNAVWLEGFDRFEDDPTPGATNQPRVRLVWDAIPEQPLCDLPAPRARRELFDGAVPPVAGDPQAQLTGAQKFENYITHTILHEIGHTLGLRHNFKGSLVAPTSSVMDYVLDDPAVATPTPQPYDREAVQYLYGLAATLPTAAFCTDDDTRRDPDCARFDDTDDPLAKYWGPLYTPVLEAYLAARSNVQPNNTLNNVLKYVRAGSAAKRAAAFALATSGVRAPLDPAAVAALQPGRGARVDAIARKILARLYLDPAEQRGDFTADPPASDAAFNAALLAELRGNLVNQDRLRSFATRRVCVDILKKLQTQAAYQVLVEARAALASERLTLSPIDAALLDDLAARIDAATSPYFTN